MTILFMAAMTMVTMTTACSSDDPLSNDNDNNGWSDDGSSDGSSSGGGTTTSTYSEMSTFTIAIDKTTAEPTSTATATYPDDVAAFDASNFGTTVNIDMSNPTDPGVSGVTLTIDGNHVTANHGSTEGICYVVTGTTTDGSLTIKGDTNFELNLNGADITNPASTAINVDSKKITYLVLTGTNKVTDGTTADDSHKGALYTKGSLVISGTGSLDVYGTYNNGIHSKGDVVIEKGVNLYAKSTANHGIKAGNDLHINGGIINVEVSANGAKAINVDNSATINGGRTTVIATGDGEWEEDETLSTGGDTKAAAGIASDNILTINGGEVHAKATGSGGKGLKADYEGYITGGKVRVITEGGLYYNNGTTESLNYTGNTDNVKSAYTSSPKGIKIGTKDENDNVLGDPVLAISGGDIMVRTSGNNAEGIESKGTLEVSGGTVLVYAHDDAINSTGDLTISGGTVVAVGTNNDGIDSNGNMYLKGGTLIAFGASGAEAGIDIDEQHKLYITGGYIFGIGGRIDGSLGSTSQGIITTTGSTTANSTVSISNSSKTLYTFNMPPVSYSNGTMLISTPDLSSGSSYTLKSGSSSTTVTASNTISSTMGGGGQPGGGGGPGGFGGH